MWEDIWQTKYAWNYYTIKSPNYCRNSPKGCYWPRGKVLGGSSAANMMIYVRGNKRDYDNWERLGNPTWNWENVLYYFKKSEDCRVESLVKAYDGKYHAAGGLLKVMNYANTDPFREIYMEAGAELGIKTLNSIDSTYIGLNKMLGTFDYESRDSAAKAFLISAKNRTNLDIIYNAHVTKIVLNAENRAIGIEFVVNNVKFKALARREVILSAGAIASPQLLMLSGIGDQNELSKFNIKTRLHAPGVGKNLQDHPLVPVMLKVNTPTLFSAFKQNREAELFDYIAYKRGQLTREGFFDIAGYFNTANYQDPYPDIQVIADHIKKGFAAHIFGNGYGKHLSQDIVQQINDTEVFIFVFSLISAKSIGDIRLRSTNPFDAPVINPNYYSNPHDMATYIRSIKFMFRFLKTKAFRRHNIEPAIVSIPGCGTFGTDAYWDCYIRFMADTTFHNLGFLSK